jgi:hypothetical protein
VECHWEKSHPLVNLKVIGKSIILGIGRKIGINHLKKHYSKKGKDFLKFYLVIIELEIK